MKKKIRKRIVLFLLLLAIFITASIVFDLSSVLVNLIARVQGAGIIAYIVFFLLYVLSTVFLIPGSLLTLASGFFFGFGLGSFLTVISATFGLAVAFMVSRYAMHDWATKQFAKRQYTQAINTAIKKRGSIIVLLLRLCPLVPFNALNYVLGLTSIRYIPYVLISFVGIIPGSILFTYFGSVANTITSLTEKAGPPDTLRWIMLGWGVVSASIAAGIISRVAKKHIAEDMPQNSEEQQDAE